jgi:putative metallohydrolase (TIGR04338 family)
MDRDTQRSRVYAAESLVRRIYDRADDSGSRSVDVHGSTLTLPVERRFASVESVQHYVDLVLALGWVRAEWPTRAAAPVAIRARRGETQAHYESATATIAMPPFVNNHAWAMREFVLLHEIAHHLQADPDHASHGPQFVDRFTTLVTEIIGPEAGLLLRGAMHESGVTIRSSPAPP